MKPGRRPESSGKTPRRHAGDVAFHLQNAVQSLNAVMESARERELFEAARALRDALVHDLERAALLKKLAARLQAEKKSPHVAKT